MECPTCGQWCSQFGHCEPCAVGLTRCFRTFDVERPPSAYDRRFFRRKKKGECAVKREYLVKFFKELADFVMYGDIDEEPVPDSLKRKDDDLRDDSEVATRTQIAARLLRLSEDIQSATVSTDPMACALYTKFDASKERSPMGTCACCNCKRATWWETDGWYCSECRA